MDRLKDFIEYVFFEYSFFLIPLSVLIVLISVYWFIIPSKHDVRRLTCYSGGNIIFDKSVYGAYNSDNMFYFYKYETDKTYSVISGDCIMDSIPKDMPKELE